MATRSVIPSGMSALPGSPDEKGFVPTARMLMQGVVMSADLRRHAVLGGEFVRMTVSSYAATFEVLADVADLLDRNGRPIVPHPGSVVSGQFWLAGRLVEGERS